MIMAGASAIGIGTGVYSRGIDVFKKYVKRLANGCRKTVSTV